MINQINLNHSAAAKMSSAVTDNLIDEHTNNTDISGWLEN